MTDEPGRPPDDPPGQRAACAELIAQCQRPLYAYVRLLGHNDADALDVLQETFSIVWRKIGSVRSPTAEKAWIYRICRNAAHAYARRIRRAARHRSDGDPERVSEPAADSVADREQDERVRQQVLRLGLEQREVVALHYFAGLSLSECAAALDLPAGTVKSRLTRALGELKDFFIEAGIIERSAKHERQIEPERDGCRAARPCP